MERCQCNCKWAFFIFSQGFASSIYWFSIFGWNMLPTSFSFPRRQTHNVISEGKPSCATLVSVFLEPDQTCPGFRMLRFMLMSQEAAPKLGMRWWRILHHGTPWNPWHSQLECAVKCNDINPCCPWATILLADASLVDERLTPRVILRSNLVHHFQYESTWNILKHLVHLGQNSIPSGYVKIAIENGHWFREFSH